MLMYNKTINCVVLTLMVLIPLSLLAPSRPSPRGGASTPVVEENGGGPSSSNAAVGDNVIPVLTYPPDDEEDGGAGLAGGPTSADNRSHAKQVALWKMYDGMARQFTTRPLFPASLRSYQHPFGTCTGFRGLATFDAYAYRGNSTPAGHIPTPHIVHLYVESQRKRGRGNSATTTWRTTVQEEGPAKPPNATTSVSLGKRVLPASSLDRYGMIALNYDDAPQHNDTAIFEPLIPDVREAFSSEHESCQYVMARLLAVTAAMLRKMKVGRWFITHGTLLGAVRHGGFIPWDADIDIAVSKGDMTRIRKEWRRYLPRDMFLQSEKTEPSFHLFYGGLLGMRVKDRYSTTLATRWKSYDKKRRVIRITPFHTGVQLDFVPMQKKTAGKLKIFTSVFNYTDIYPLSAVCFEDMVLPAPRNPMGYLKRVYGSNFMELPPPAERAFRGPANLPCLAVEASRSVWALNWQQDARGTGNTSVVAANATMVNASGSPRMPVLAPRGDPFGSAATDMKEPYGTSQFKKK